LTQNKNSPESNQNTGTVNDCNNKTRNTKVAFPAKLAGNLIEGAFIMEKSSQNNKDLLNLG
jgi:hypothetical protein